MQIINWGIARHPANWATLILMVLIFLAGVEMLTHYAKVNTNISQPSAP